MVRRLDILAGETSSKPTATPRPWISIWFDCCHTYQRVYRNQAGTEYNGRCPKCLRLVRLKVGAGGTSARQFTAR